MIHRVHPILAPLLLFLVLPPGCSTAPTFYRASEGSLPTPKGVNAAVFKVEGAGDRSRVAIQALGVTSDTMPGTDQHFLAFRMQFDNYSGKNWAMDSRQLRVRIDEDPAWIKARIPGSGLIDDRIVSGHTETREYLFPLTDGQTSKPRHLVFRFEVAADGRPVPRQATFTLEKATRNQEFSLPPQPRYQANPIPLPGRVPGDPIIPMDPAK